MTGKVPRTPFADGSGLFSKAERALQFLGRSERARSDIQIFREVEADGLAPLLMMLADAASTRPSTFSRSQAATDRDQT